MSRRRQRINPMMDIAAKKVFSDSDVTTEFIEAFLGFRPKKVTILNGTVADLKIEQEGYFSTTVDVLASLEDDTQVIIEIQVAHQQGFLKRLWIYICQHLVKNLPNVRQKVAKTHEMYDKIQPVYGIALVGSNYFDDKRPVRSFVISDSETGQALKLSFDNSKQVRTPFEMVIVELKKLGHGKINTKQQLWMEFFANRKFSQKQTSAIQKAEYLLDVNNWTQEERKMIEVWNHRAASYYANMQERYDEGVDAEKIDTMKRMIKANLTDEMIAIATEFTVEQVAAYRSQSQIDDGTEYGI
ncbi:TPA: Rpn family recombination-promoting nuclease/putative transposase [Streptococcus suis]|nr:Rpn family recombination-promoting nuclease/putative transposase [Streptococcus suis]HEM6136528.1 Rpn family recombination-promoting nuclease/putative transposase [Streptococcus suis]